MGDIVTRGNTVMRGYLEDPTATREVFRDGWFRTGNLAVMHPDGYIEVKNRSKDIIISGGENISSNKPRGIPRADDRLVLNGIFSTLRSEAS